MPEVLDPLMVAPRLLVTVAYDWEKTLYALPVAAIALMLPVFST